MAEQDKEREEIEEEEDRCGGWLFYFFFFFFFFCYESIPGKHKIWILVGSLGRVRCA